MLEGELNDKVSCTGVVSSVGTGVGWYCSHTLYCGNFLQQDIIIHADCGNIGVSDKMYL